MELVIDGIDWNDLQTKLADKLKSKAHNITPSEWHTIPKATSKLEQFDDDTLINMYMNCDVEHVKLFNKYRKQAREELNELVSSIDTFENEMCEYRAQIVEIIRSNVQTLFDHHFNYVNDLYHKKKTNNIVIVNGKELQLVKSQKEFIINGLKQIIL